MPADYTYEIHRTVEAAQFRHRERDLEHRRALKAEVPAGRLVTRIVGGLRRLRPATLRPPISIQEAPVLTDRVCRLADGGLGRIAVRESDGELIEVCVPA